VGAYVYHSSKEAYAALANVRDSSLNEQEIAAKFQSFDRDASGSLDTAELAKLCQSLGSPLSHNELESALFILDKDGSGVIEYSEFLVWWKGKEY
jgi:Ca2+-binding EF-hand superfamily protein